MNTGQPVFPSRVRPALPGAWRAGAVVVATVVLGLAGCGGGDDDEAGTPLVPVTPSSAANAEAASAPAAAGAQR